jgi:Nucleotide modification associated domain 3
MKIIFSRKGFDSTSGGCPSPIFPDGTILSLVIPDKASPIQYADIRGTELLSMGEAVSQLAGIPATHRAHLDPDLSEHSVRRDRGWRPIFGQVDAAEGHLRRQGVDKGDLFLFFGLFRAVEKSSSGWKFVRGSKPIHILFGWLQVADRIPVLLWPASEAWALYHPHFHGGRGLNNSIYVGAERLTVKSGQQLAIEGAGVFSRFESNLRLTAPDSDRLGRWLLPKWFHPESRGSCLSYHGDVNRWVKTEQGVLLDTVSRGQEFVLDCDHYPEAVEWVEKMITAHV